MLPARSLRKNAGSEKQQV
uniref:Uncharacterized protein n=1 Tax=Anguilla anguilla TaxID=7936 RepID=A0A0E9PWU8_ANGAN